MQLKGILIYTDGIQDRENDFMLPETIIKGIDLVIPVLFERETIGTGTCIRRDDRIYAKLDIPNPPTELSWVLNSSSFKPCLSFEGKTIRRSHGFIAECEISGIRICARNSDPRIGEALWQLEKCEECEECP